MKKLSFALCVLFALTCLAGCADTATPAGTSSTGNTSAPSAPASLAPSQPASAPAASVPTGTPASEATAPESTPPDASLPAAEGSIADYRQVIENARPSELNELQLYAIVTGPEDGMYPDVFSESYGFMESDMARYAISLGLVITQAYGVAVILPKPGLESAVQQQLEAFVDMQKAAQENYLPDQYEIACTAIIKTAATGEVLMAMCEDAATVMANMEAALQAS